jgi:serine/threonine protein phosphatase 1
MNKYINCIAVIGDIHGCLKQLRELYGKLAEFDVPVYSVGDFIDRGENSRGVIDFLMKKKILAVMGNHEKWLIDTMTDEDAAASFKGWISVGGAQTMISYFKDVNDVTIKDFKEKFINSGHYDFISSLPLKIEINNVFISHAGKIAGGDDKSLYFNYLEPEKLEGKLQIFGHRPQENMDYHKGWYANVDTGCVYGNKLTGVIVDTVSAEIIESINIKNTKKL